VAERYIAECPAKINLYLRVGEPDATGFHPLETEFQAIGLFDTLEVTVGGSGFEVAGVDLPPENTVTRALRLMREVATLPPLGVKLIKRIPAQAGLGGGSSDAAGLLRVLRKLLPVSVPERDFIMVAKSVGADVPFFLVGGRAAGSGYGDVVTALPDGDTRWLVVVKPDHGCSTPEMYATLDRVRAAGGRMFGIAKGWIENDFLLATNSYFLDQISELSMTGLEPVGLCGSGSGYFGFANMESQARQVAARFPCAWAVPTLGRAESLAVARG
jgi:4-diphosphocytidyl-2-C-methyl-D-erythritol kinase